MTTNNHGDTQIETSIGTINEEAASELYGNSGIPDSLTPAEISSVLVEGGEEFYNNLDDETYSAVEENVSEVVESHLGDKPRVASDGGQDEYGDADTPRLWDGVTGWINDNPKKAALAGAGLTVTTLGCVGLYSSMQEDNSYQDENNVNETKTPGGGPSEPTDNGTQEPTDNGTEQTEENTTETPTNEYTLGDVNRTLSAANITEDDLLNEYLDDNISRDHVEAVYDVFDDELDNGTELVDLITDEDGNISLEYIKDEYRGNGTSTELENGTSISDILDSDQIFDDVRNESQESIGLQDDIVFIEEWYDNEYEEQIAREIAEEQTNASAENLTFERNGGNFTVNGTLISEEGDFQETVNISYEDIIDSKQNFSTALKSLETARNIEASQSNENSTYSQNLINELNSGNFDTILKSQSIGQAYEEDTQDRSTNITQEFMLKSFLDGNITEREVDYLDSNISQAIENVDNPASDAWAGDNIDNHFKLDLGISPFTENELLSDYDVIMEDVGESGFGNNYTVEFEGERESFTSNVTSDQVNTFSSSFRMLDHRFNSLQEDSGLTGSDFYRGITEEEVDHVVKFSLDNLENNTNTVTDLAAMSVVDEDGIMSEKIGVTDELDNRLENDDTVSFLYEHLVEEDNFEELNEEDIRAVNQNFSEIQNSGDSFSSGEVNFPYDRLVLTQGDLRDVSEAIGDEIPTDATPEEFVEGLEEYQEPDFSGGGGSGGNDDGDDGDDDKPPRDGGPIHSVSSEILRWLG